MNTYIAHTVRGLEDICLQELKDNLKVEVSEVVPKKVVFVNGEDISLFQKLHTIDDVSILVADFPFEREWFTDLSHFDQLVASLDFTIARDVISKVRELGNTFSITVTAPNLKGISQKEIQERAAEIVAAKTGWKYTEMEHTNFDVRINIEATEWFISVRLFPKPLHERNYSNLSHTATLKPTIAAALVYLVGKEGKGKSLVDSFCGTGTILCEAARYGYDVYGGDINSQSIADAKLNLEQCGISPNNVHVRNAIKSKLEDARFDCAISNLPWNEKVKVKSITELLAGIAKEYKRIVKTGGKICFLAKRSDLLIKYLKKEFPDSKIQRTDISFNGQNPSIVLVE